jgi:A/G-specific adenine glycosylase
MKPLELKKFQKTVWDYYHANKRNALPWRKNTKPYNVYVSEIMLQQTQVDRVVDFFNKWMKEFPTIKALAEAKQSDVLRLWKGLGYNSRAIRMKRTAQIIMEKFGGKFPKSYEDILSLPGIGPYTAGAISAFAYNQPVSMIETNIRRVYLHHFFPTPQSKHTRPLRVAPSLKERADFVTSIQKLESCNQVEISAPSFRGGGRRPGASGIHDKELIKLIEKTVDQENPREWYWALMDYGSYLGKTIPNPNKKSRHYTKQSKFEGSNREIRGKILEILLEKKKLSVEKLEEKLESFSDDKDRIETIVSGLEREGFLILKNGKVVLK